jgi:hypothetical protein
MIKITGFTLELLALAGGAIQDIEDQRGFPEPETPVTATNHPSGIRPQFFRLWWRAL